MKKLLLLTLFCANALFAQETDTSALSGRRNEVRVDVLSIVAASKFNVSYERFLGERFSVGLALGYSDNKKINDDFDNGYRNTVPKYEVLPYMRYKLSESVLRYYFAEVFLSANGGDFKEIVRRVNDAGSGYYQVEKSTYSDFGVGAGAGYKMYFKEKIAVELLVGIGTNLVDRDKSPDTISRVGLSVGYRF